VDMRLEDISLIMNDGAKFVGKDGIPLDMNYFKECIKKNILKNKRNRDRKTK